MSLLVKKEKEEEAQEEEELASSDDMMILSSSASTSRPESRKVFSYEQTVTTALLTSLPTRRVFICPCHHKHFVDTETFYFFSTLDFKTN